MSLVSGTRDLVIQEYLWRFVVSKQTSAVRNMKNLEINAKEKTFSVKLELAGESEPLIVTGRYNIVLKDDKTFFAPTDGIATSKEWLTILAAEFLKGRTFEIPNIVGKFL